MISMKIKGGKTTVSNIRRFAPFAVNRLNERFNDVVMTVMDSAVELCPMDTGNLRKTAFIVGPGYDKTKYNKLTVTFANKRDDVGELVAGMQTARIKYIGEAMGMGINVKYSPHLFAGFSAYYAVTVHETQQNYRVGQWKFLQTAVDMHTPMVYDTLYRNLKGTIRAYNVIATKV